MDASHYQPGSVLSRAAGHPLQPIVSEPMKQHENAAIALCVRTQLL